MPPSLTFEEACALVRDRPAAMRVSDSDKRLLYVYYKVATVGPAPDVPAPLRASPRYPYWKAWATFGARLSPADARDMYVRAVETARDRSARLE